MQVNFFYFYVILHFQLHFSTAFVISTKILITFLLSFYMQWSRKSSESEGARISSTIQIYTKFSLGILQNSENVGGAPVLPCPACLPNNTPIPLPTPLPFIFAHCHAHCAKVFKLSTSVHIAPCY